MKTIKDLEIGQSGRILSVGGEGALRQHILDMGLIPGVDITIIKYAPMGDPVELRVHGYELTLRLEDAAKIEVAVVEKVEEEKKVLIKEKKHPGLGEEEIFKLGKERKTADHQEPLTFALVGNQNCGKTTLFNQLTGSSQHVGNFPGVTVDKKEGIIRGYSYAHIIDLPGIYSLSPYSSEEIVSRNYVMNKPDAIINIVDAMNIERNLYLTMQLLEMDLPIVVALNMMDEVKNNGGYIDINTLEEELGVPVVPISAAKNEGVDELIKHAIHVAKYKEVPQRVDYCDKHDHNGAVHRCLHGVRHLIEDHAKSAHIPVRFAASKLIEGDALIEEALHLDDNEQETIDHIVLQMEKERGLDKNASIADMRFGFIMKVCQKAVIKPHISKEHLRSESIDRILTGKYTAIPMFMLIMMMVFYLTFDVIGVFFQDLLAQGVAQVSSLVDAWMVSAHVNPVVHGLVIDGIFEGVGSVLSFLPIIVTLFFFLSLLEDSGYIARVAFFMDKLLRKMGLSGRSIVPMLIGFGCTVPAVMSTRTLPSERDRRMTILLTPFMSCSAKMPIYAFFAGAFFKPYSALVMAGLYILGILMAIVVSLVFKDTLFKGEAVPFVMELPNYRMPGVKNVAQLLWEKSKDFIQRAFTVIFMATVLIWFMKSFDIHFNMVNESHHSLLAMISGGLVPLFAPLGLADWRIVTSLVSGFMAKESVVSTMQVLFSGSHLNQVLTVASASSLLVFSLLYTPCVAAIASIKRELGTRWAIGVVLWQCLIAWVVSFVIYNIIQIL